MKAYWEWRYSSTHSLTLALDGDEWSASRPGRFTPRERAPGTNNNNNNNNNIAIKAVFINIMLDSLQNYSFVWRTAANILNKQSRTADKGWSSSLAVGRGANNPSP
jgi:hypothetical protein